MDVVAKVLEMEGEVLERFIWSTLPSFKEVSGGKYDFNYHFDGKAEVSRYLKGKDGGRVWERSSLLNMAFYMDNLMRYGLMGGVCSPLPCAFCCRMRIEGADEEQIMENGKYILRKAGKTDAVHPFVSTGDTGEFVDLLVRSPPKQDLLGVSEMSTYVEYMKIWSEVTGVPSEVRKITVEEADKAAPGGLGREAAESDATSAEFGWGKDLVIPRDVSTVLWVVAVC